MNIWRIALAILITFLLLSVARRLSLGHPELINRSVNGYSLQMTTVPKAPERSRARMEFTVQGPSLGSDARVRLVCVPPSPYLTVPLVAADSSRGLYFTEVSAGARGGQVSYVIEVVNSADSVLARFDQADGKPFTLRFIGAVPPFVLIGHIAFIFGSVFCVTMAALLGWSVRKGAGNVREMLAAMFFGTLFALLGGYPFGFAMNWYAFGGIWEGVPFGTDATDNKTQLLVVYLLFATLAGLKTLSAGKYGSDLHGPRTLATLALIGFVVMLGIYLIPHSIQFTPLVTKAVCYSFIGVFALWYLIGYLISRRTAS